MPTDPAPPTPPDEDVAALRRDRDEAREQLAATGEILRAMGRSAADLEGVLTVVAEAASRLCRADAALIYLLEEGAFRVAAAAGVSDDYLAYVQLHPMLADRATLSGRVAVDRRAQHIEDVLADPEYGRPELQRVGGFRSTLAVPMLVEDEVMGVVNLWRSEVNPFSERAIELVTTFAAQAAIAIRSVDLVRAFAARSRDLAATVEQLEALRDVGHAVSSSLQLDEVLTTIVTHAVQLTDTDGGSVFELDAAAREFRVRAAYGSGQELVAALRQTRISLDETLVGRACLDGEPRMLSDLEHATLDPHLQVLKEAGWRSILAVPILHEGDI
ncbi:MAG: GAF domain-containing protein, partial [Candidatus Nanopelagicales bacterium]